MSRLTENHRKLKVGSHDPIFASNLLVHFLDDNWICANANV